jgi:ribose-phosphate pyrophosphokinase
MKKEIIIFSGKSCPNLSEDVARELNISPGKIDLKKFSCGENYVRYEESLRGKKVFLIQTCRTGKMNDDLMELFLMIDAAKQSFAKEIIVIIPYLAYSRQDKIHAAREGISAKLIANFIQKAGANQVINLHLHCDQIQGFFNIPVDNLNPSHLFVDYFRGKKINDLVVVSPDAGGAKSAQKFADELNVPLVIMHKQRPAHNVAEITKIIGNVAGKTPIIIDDMIDTGGSVCGAKEALVKNGSNEDVYLCATHAIFSGPAIENLNKANFKEVVCTNSLPLPKNLNNLQEVSIAKLLASAIKNIAENSSVSKICA